jgi:hypothetical protein
MKEKAVQVFTKIIHENEEEQKFKLPEDAILLQVLQEGANLASAALLPNPQDPLDRLHFIRNHDEIGPPIDLQEELGNFLENEHGKHLFGIELVLSFRVNTRWAISQMPQLTPRQILELFGMNYQEYTLYGAGSTDPLPIDTPITIQRGMPFEAQRDGQYGGELTL